LATMGRLAEAWRICRDEAATPMPSLRKKLTPSHGNSRNPCTQNPTPITSRRLASVSAAITACFSSSMATPLSSHYTNPNLDRVCGCSVPPNPGREKRLRAGGVDLARTRTRRAAIDQSIKRTVNRHSGSTVRLPTRLVAEHATGARGCQRGDEKSSAQLRPNPRGLWCTV
jgi:hypothetical protein